jgi:hypothetical protein
MTETGPENIDDLMMGNVSESASESDEKFKARVASAQAKLAKIKKDESKSKDFDHKLSKLITALDPHTLRLVVFLINNGVQSLTILAMISLVNAKAEKICHTEFHKFIEESADFSETKLKPELEKQVSLWWTYTLAANQVATDAKLSKFEHDEVFREFVELECGEMMKRFLASHKVEEHDLSLLKQALKKYEGMLFTESKS